MPNEQPTPICDEAKRKFEAHASLLTNEQFAELCQDGQKLNAYLESSPPTGWDLACTLEQQLRDSQEQVKKLMLSLSVELGIEKGEPNAGSDSTKEYWIGIDQQCYESLKDAVNAALSNQTNRKRVKVCK